MLLLLLLLGLSFRPPLSLNQNCTTAKSKLEAKDTVLTGIRKVKTYKTDEMKIILQKDPQKNNEKRGKEKFSESFLFMVLHLLQ